MPLDRISQALAKHAERKAEADKYAARLSELDSMHAQTTKKLADIEKEIEQWLDGMNSIYGDGEYPNLKLKIG